jgi:hypothetical protein
MAGWNRLFSLPEDEGKRGESVIHSCIQYAIGDM